MDSAGLSIICEQEIARDALPVRGVGWVLKWAGTIAVLLFATTIFTNFTIQLAAERALANAAAAGLREAALPRATSESVSRVVRQRLGAHGYPARAATMQFEQNGQPVRGVVRPQCGDQIAISLSIHTRAILPRWLPMPAWLTAGTVEWHAKRFVN